MEERFNVRKDIVENNWIEFLTDLKRANIEQKKKAEETRKARAEAFIAGKKFDGDCDRSNLLGGETVDGGVYWMDVSSFWRWYTEKKIDLEESK